MTLTVDLTTLIANVREKADMVNSQFVTDAELTKRINSSYQAFYDMLIDADQDYNLSSTNITLSASDAGSKALATDFYKLRGIDDLTDSAHPKSVRNFNWNERNDFNNLGVTLSPYDYSDVTYRIAGSNLIFQPIENSYKSFKVWYYPLPTLLSAPGDTMDTINGWDEYITLDVAAYCLDKEESDSSAMKAERAVIAQRIENMKTSRDHGLPEKISRVRNRRRLGLYPFRGDYPP